MHNRLEIRTPKTFRRAAKRPLSISWFVLLALLAVGCGGSDAQGSTASVGDAAGTAASVDNESGDAASGDDPATAAPSDCGPGDAEEELRAYAQSLYLDGVNLKGDLTSECLGASPCTMHSLSTVLTFKIRFVVLPDGSWLNEREFDEEQPTGEALQKCFWDEGLEPTADDVAVVTASLWSTVLGLNPTGFPEEGLSELTDAARELPVDFENYEGPRIEQIDGVPTAVFIAEDKLASWYVVQTVLEPEVSSTVNAVYVAS